MFFSRRVDKVRVDEKVAQLNVYNSARWLYSVSCTLYSICVLYQLYSVLCTLYSVLYFYFFALRIKKSSII